MTEQPWFNFYPEEIPHTIEYEEKPLHHFLIDTSNRIGGKKALNFMGKDLTFNNVLSEAQKIAHFLQAKGLRKGNRVAIMLPNTPQAVIAYYGALMAGGVVVQVNPLFTERELSYQMEDSG